MLHRDARPAAREAFETRRHRRQVAGGLGAAHFAREQREIASRAAALLALDDARRVERTAHHRIGVAALFARDRERVGGGTRDAQFEQRGLARHRGAEPRVGGAQRLDLGGIGDRDDAALAARAVGELRRAHAARKHHADHEQRREQEEEEGRRRDDREKVAPRNNEHIADEGGHALASSIASSAASASKPAST